MNERINDLIVLAALGELTDDERRELDAAAQADPQIAAELDAEMKTAAALLGSAPTAAPESLRGSVLDAIATTEQEVGGEAETAAAVPSIDVARERRSRRLAPMLSAAAAVALLAVGSVVLLTRGDDVSEFDAVAEASDAQRRPFDGDLAGSLTVVHSPSENAIAIDGRGVPTPSANMAYVLWFITDDSAMPVGEFRPDDDGDIEVRLDDLDPDGFVLGVTEEPVGGSATPTLPILATA